MKNPTKAERKMQLFNRLMALGFTYQECVSLYKIEMTLHRWYEKECGDEFGNCIERGEICDLQLMDSPEGKTGIWVVDKREKYIWPVRDCHTTDINSPEAKRALRREQELNIPGQAYMTYDKGFNGQRGKYRIADRETAAIKRLDAIMLGKGHLWYYIQSDPRGCALYIGKLADMLNPIDEVIVKAKSLGAKLHFRDIEDRVPSACYVVLDMPNTPLWTATFNNEHLAAEAYLKQIGQSVPNCKAYLDIDANYNRGIAVCI